MSLNGSVCLCWSGRGPTLRVETADGWHRSSPLAAVFYLGRIWQLLARNALQSLAPLAAFMVAFGGNPIARLALGASLFALVTVVTAIARYLAFRYCITEHAVLIRDGVFHKKQLDIRYERVQAVNTTRGPLDRLFGLVNVSFDTAGSSGEEGQLPAVPMRLAEQLRERINRTPKAPAAEDAAGPDRRTLLRLGAGDMVRIGVSSGRVFLVLALLGPLSEALDLELHERLEETAVMEALGAGEPWGMPTPVLWLTAAAALVLVLFAAAVVAAFLRHHRYELSADAQVLHSTGGLLTRHEHAVDKKKIQSLVATQNPVLRLFRRYRLRLRQAASGRGGGAKAFIVPLCAPGELPVLEREVFADEFARLTLDPRAAVFRRISPYYLRSRTALFGAAPALTACVVLFPLLGPAAFGALLWIPLAGGAAYQVWRRLGVLVTRDGLALRSGFVGFRISAHLHRKVQKVTLHQSPFQRRRGLATLHLYLAAGSVSVPFIERAYAERLRDYVLWRLETSTRPWH